MEENQDIVSALNALSNKVEDLERRVNQVLMKQLQTKKEIDLIQEKPENIEDEVCEGKTELEFPEEYHFSENLQKIMECMVESQNNWLESVQKSKQTQTGLKGLKIFDEMTKHLTDRLHYLEMSKTLIEGPLLEDPPPPAPPPEEPPEEVVKEDTGGKKKKKGKKDGAKKSKKK